MFATRCAPVRTYGTRTAVTLNAVKLSREGADAREAPLIVLHGLFGSARNYQTLLGNELRAQPQHSALRRLAIVPDLRNHGASPHSPSMRYEDMAADVLKLLDDEKLDTCVLMGHSMGAKAVMHFCIMHPERVERAILLDCAPASYFEDPRWETVKTVRALRSVNFDLVNERNDVNKMLKEHIANTQLRLFLLTNVVRNAESKQWQWRVNLDAIESHIAHLGGFVHELKDGSKPFRKPVLFIGGGNSFYLQDEQYARTIPRFFTQFRVENVQNAGHWVHVDQPQNVMQLVRSFISENKM